MGIVKYEIDIEAPLSEEQKREIREAASHPIEFDEDCPELNSKQISEIKQMLEEKRKAEQKQVISLRIAGKYVEKAKKLGKGYTSILSDVIEHVLDDPELLKKCIAETK